MKLLKFTLLLAGCFAFCRLTAQDPYFVQGIYADKTDVCRGEQVRVSARVAKVAYYEFQLRDTDTGDWVRLSSGNTDTTLTAIEHLFYSVNGSFTVRILLKNSRSELTGDPYDIRVRRPVFDIQPPDLTQCNGGEVTFNASADGVTSWQWESSSDGGLHFSPLSVTTKFRDVNTPHLKVTGIVNSHHGLAFRCRVKDAYQCEALSETAVLSVNQLSTAVSPTTSTAFCEGDTARFFPAALTGPATSFQWLMRKTGQTSYSPLEETEKFTGTSTQNLLVNGIRPDENSYRIKVGFTALTQNPSGRVDSSVCYLESTRANYTIHPRPTPPASLDSLESCGPASFLISGTENYYWYEDTLASPVRQNVPSYLTPELSASRVYYYSVKDLRSCESYRQAIKVFIRPVPVQTFSIPDGVCPTESRVPVTLTGAENTPRYLFVHSPDLDGFLSADSLPAALLTEVDLPLQKSPGSYTLRVHSKNEHCVSDTSELRLNILQPTRIHPTLNDLSVCETEKIRIRVGFEAEGPVNIAWYRNEAELEGHTADSLVIPSADPSHEGAYSVKVSGRCGEEISPPFMVRVLPAVTLLTQPRDTAICENATATFRVRATGNGLLNYQWFINDHAVPGNTDSLLIAHAGHELNGARVVCKITSGCLREILSDTITLTVRPLPAPPAVSDTLVFCTSAPVIHLEQSTFSLNWYDPHRERLPSPEVNVADLKDRTYFVSQTDSYGCESPLKSFLTLVYAAFSITAVTDREELCLSGNFNRNVQLATFTNTPDPVSFRLLHEGHVLETNPTGNFSVHQPGLYVIQGAQEHCSASDSIRIRPVSVDLSHLPAVSDTETCFGGTALLSASSDYTGGTYYWWTEQEGYSGFSTGEETVVPGIVSDTAFFVSYGLQNGNLFCESPRSKVVITTPPRLMAGRIAENTAVNCAGYNPPLISSMEPPVAHTQIQWQFTESCESPQWQDIAGATGLTYNPGVLQATTCFRRKAWNSCDTLYSNTTTVRIAPDPALTISAGQSTVCSGDSLTLQTTLTGGAGNCTILWQVNRVSSAASNPNWTDAGSGPELNYADSGSDGPLHFRARVNCDLSSCNLAVSNVVSVRFLRELTLIPAFSDTTVCEGTTLSLSAEGCAGGELLWSTGQTSPVITLQPRADTTLTVTCTNACENIVKPVKIKVTRGIKSPESTTPDSLFTPAILQFSAHGEGLKWYSSPSVTLSLDTAPALSVPGTYTFWVSQTVGNCESPRTAVSATLFNTLRIRSQTQQMANCYGNVSHLQIQAEGEGSLSYRWQRMLPGDSLFTDITGNSYLSGVQSPSLRIGSTGNTESPHEARFRCIITDAFHEISSEEVSLTVNRLLGNLPNQTLCSGNDLHADLRSTHTLTGTPLHFEWQHRPGTGQPWVALKDTGHVSGSATPYLKIPGLPELDQLQYRCAVTFTSHNGSCVETTDLMTLKVGGFPEKPSDIEKEACQAGTLEKLTLYPPENTKVVWYSLNDSISLSRQPEVSTDAAGHYFMQYTYISDKKCESPRALVQITVHPSPPLPVNTTPWVYDETESLTFSAEGENLKWYRTRTLKQFELYPPVFTSTGKKSYYVTQADVRGCESERLLIESEIRPVFRITTQPRDQSNCDGNTVTFGVRIAGGSAVTYQWQREYSGLFADIPGATERDCRISDAGTEPDRDGTRYRCIVRSGEKQLVSQTAALRVNLLKPSLPDIDLCPGASIDFSRYRDSISGDIQKMEWQRRSGNTYSTVFEAPVLTQAFTPGPDDPGTYRLRITFQNPGGTCVRNSNAIRVTQHTLPDLSSLDSVRICEGLTVASLLKTLPENLILFGSDSLETTPGHSLRPGDQYLIATSNAAGCTTPFRKFSPVILPKPRVNPVDTLIQICRFSPALSDRSLLNEKTWWRLPGRGWSPELEIVTSSAAEHLVAFKTEGENGCFSDSARMTLQIAPCYFAGQIDTCIDFPATALQTGTWNYFYRENGEIFAALHPQGVNTGSVNLRLSSTAHSSWEDPAGNRFYPRSLSLNASRKLSSKVKIRYYMSQSEINNYPEDANETLLLLHQEEFREDCLPEPADLSVLWLKDTLRWESTGHEKYRYLEFETEATGRYFLWKNQAPAGRLNAEPTSQSVLISAESIRTMPFGNYRIYKSRDGISWQEWRSGINHPVRIRDATPHIPETWYRLIFDFGNQIRAVLDTRKAEISGESPECILLENPVSDGRNIGLWFPDLQKSSTKLVTLHGQEVPLLNITENGEHYRITPVNALAKGAYYLKTENRSGIPCTKRIIVL